MKSEKASACLEKCAIQSKDPYVGRYVLYHEAAICMDIAEEEAEKRVRDELTRWHDPKEELPDTNRDVLIKTTMAAKYKIAFYKKSSFHNHHWQENNGAIDDDMILGWREIPE